MSQTVLDRNAGRARALLADLASVRRPNAFVVVTVLLGALGVAAPWMMGSPLPDSGAQLLSYAAFSAVCGVWLSYLEPNRTGRLVVVNSAVTFSFAILLTWGLVPALGAHLLSAGFLVWYRGVPTVRSVFATFQVFAAYAGAYGVLRLDGRRGPQGHEWTQGHDATIVSGAAAAWLVIYLGISAVFSRVDLQRIGTKVPPPTTNAVLFYASIVVLGPAAAVAGDIAVPLAALIMVPLFAAVRMSRLAVERQRASRVDPLTGIGNRLMLRESFEGFLAPDQRPQTQSLALALVSLDRMKYINDSLGFEAGDRVLTTVASRLTATYNRGETVVRLGGDDFAVLVAVPDEAAADELATRCEQALREPIAVENLLVDVTASVGLVTRSTSSPDDFTTVLRQAYSAMYLAKRQGNEVAVYSGPAGTEAEPDRLHLLTDFRRALTSPGAKEVVMHYQPQRNLITGEIESLEALMRWTHPVYGPIDPTTVLSVVERTTVVHLLTTYAIDEVCAQLAIWQADDRVGVRRVAVNISARDLYSDSLVRELGQQIRHHHLPPHSLQVEITESALMPDPVRARDTLRRIADLGVDISLDDFGTGFSSLQYLRVAPVDEIKIDKSFVVDMARNGNDAAIVETTIDMAHALNLRVVAEGIEDESTLLMLERLGCDLGQGWHISHPLPHEEVLRFIR